MAQPTINLEVWAKQDVNLPGTNQPNKERPIDDLWAKGYDKGQKPGCEEWNYIWNMTTGWMAYIRDEQIPGLDSKYLKIASNLADVPNKATARTNLEIYSKTESDGRYVNVTGDTMTGTLWLPTLRFSQVASSDGAWITATAAGSDKTYLDFGLSDNPGDPTAANSIVDLMRWRFLPTGGTEFSMMELNALNSTTGYLRVFGNIWSRRLDVSGPITWTGAATGGTLALTGAITAASLGVSGAVTAATMTATGQIQGGSMRTGTLTATGAMTGTSLSLSGQVSASSASISGATSTNSLTVSSNVATVGGRNIVRSINGTTADAAGNVTINVSGFVSAVRLGARITAGVSESPFYPGHVMTGWAYGNKKELRGATYYSAPLQYFINGSWVTVTNVS